MPDSSVLGIFQARILEWVSYSIQYYSAISYSIQYYNGIQVITYLSKLREYTPSRVNPSAGPWIVISASLWCGVLTLRMYLCVESETYTRNCWFLFNFVMNLKLLLKSLFLKEVVVVKLFIFIWTPSDWTIILCVWQSWCWTKNCISSRHNMLFYLLFSSAKFFFLIWTFEELLYKSAPIFCNGIQLSVNRFSKFLLNLFKIS